MTAVIVQVVGCALLAAVGIACLAAAMWRREF